jgi:hypothetical protein
MVRVSGTGRDPSGAGRQSKLAQRVAMRSTPRGWITMTSATMARTATYAGIEIVMPALSNS